MSVQAMSRVMANKTSRSTNRLVLLIMANRCGGDDDVCFASIERIADDCCISTRSVQRAQTALVKSGHLLFLGVHPKYRTNMHAVMPVEGVSDSHPHVIPGPQVTPELEVTGVKGSEVGLASVGGSSKARTASTRPTEDQAYLAEKICETWGVTRGHLSHAAVQKLNQRFGVDAVTSALRSLRGFPPEEQVESPYAYVVAICEAA